MGHVQKGINTHRMRKKDAQQSYIDTLYVVKDHERYELHQIDFHFLFKILQFTSFCNRSKQIGPKSIMIHNVLSWKVARITKMSFNEMA